MMRRRRRASFCDSIERNTYSISAGGALRSTEHQRIDFLHCSITIGVRARKPWFLFRLRADDRGFNRFYPRFRRTDDGSIVPFWFRIDREVVVSSQAIAQVADVDPNAKGYRWSAPRISAEGSFLILAANTLISATTGLRFSRSSEARLDIRLRLS